MEIKGFNEHLYLFKKNHNFKKVCMNYGCDGYKEVLWAIKKPIKLSNGEKYTYHTDINCIISEYDISVDKSIQSLYVIDNIQAGNVTFRESVDIWLELAHKTVAYNGITHEARMEKVLSILGNIPTDKWESFFVRFIYGFNHNKFNSFLIAFLIEISTYVSGEYFITIENHQGINHQFPQICQFYDKFKFKFAQKELSLLWINLIKKENQVIVESIHTHAIAQYLLALFNDKEKQQLFAFFPLMQEKFNTTNNQDNPFEFERNKKHKRFLFEFHNEQMTKNISVHLPGWSYKTFKEISDQFLKYLATTYIMPNPQFISKDNDPIYSSIVYAESQEQINLFREILLSVFDYYFIEAGINEINKHELLEQGRFNTSVLKIILDHSINKYSKEPLDEDILDNDEFKL